MRILGGKIIVFNAAKFCHNMWILPCIKIKYLIYMSQGYIEK